MEAKVRCPYTSGFAYKNDLCNCLPLLEHQLALQTMRLLNWFSGASQESRSVILHFAAGTNHLWVAEFRSEVEAECICQVPGVCCGWHAVDFEASSSGIEEIGLAAGLGMS